jgi:hypothetical protein
MVSTRKSTNLNKWVLAMVLFLALGLIFWGLYYWWGPRDGFVSPDEIKAKTAAIPPAPDKVCEMPGDPKFVSQNYSVCCPKGDTSPNCICRLPGIKSCQQKYKDCLEGRLFSQESMDFLGRDNMPEVCKKLMDGCFTSSGKDMPVPSPVTGMKPDLSISENNICQIDGYKKDELPAFCGSVCSDITGCQYYQTDSLLGSCGLYKGQPTQLEKGAASSTMGNYQLFRRTEGFVDAGQTGSAAKFCLSGATDKCLGEGKTNSTSDCLCSHSVIKDCQKQNQSCLKAGGNAKSCMQQFGNCCGLVDTTDSTAGASMSTNGKIGSGPNNNLLCKPSNISSLADCKTACLKHDKCKFIDSNMMDAKSKGSSTSGAGADRKGADGLTPYCYLFSGEPSESGKVMLGKQSNMRESIYSKLAGSTDEREANNAISQK